MKTYDEYCNALDAAGANNNSARWRLAEERDAEWQAQIKALELERREGAAQAHWDGIVQGWQMGVQAAKNIADEFENEALSLTIGELIEEGPPKP